MALSSKGTALITGASSGIGAVYADRLARQGYDLILVARSQAKLNALANHLSNETGRAVEVVAADLKDKADVRRVEDILCTDASITLLVNNAGVGGVMPLLGSPVDEMEDMITLNVTALMRLAYAVVPGFVARGTGTVINIASIVAIAPEILNGVYGGTKAFVLSLSQSMQHELADKGLRIQAVLPGATATDFWSEAGNPVENLPQEIVMTAEDMVDAALVGLASGEVVTIPGLHDGAQFERYEAQRKLLSGLFGNSTAAPRYR
ncbi:SDR family oxidoreductase [Pseudomonas sp. 14P_8.1_Bac3]|uniref:SDR family NAD(P)-dependent oxidoreductase n=1 Tax=Pseudomonas sp. 14P_8.1_Bac3 TaxID=2971621 RepID=UPI0021CA11CE|nr:SDR family oxidoreductase [Pseudomonas sp. 14P_8.1_Bac3]MCU1761009.1 SDR family oxidoreductase [Pseudomonas sp. 14P_8.1_Bac3]